MYILNHLLLKQFSLGFISGNAHMYFNIYYYYNIESLLALLYFLTFSKTPLVPMSINVASLFEVQKAHIHPLARFSLGWRISSL